MWVSVATVLATCVSYFPALLVAQRWWADGRADFFVITAFAGLCALAAGRALCSADRTPVLTVKDLTVSPLMLFIILGPVDADDSIEKLLVVFPLVVTYPLCLRATRAVDWRTELAVAFILLEIMALMGCDLGLSAAMLLWSVLGAQAISHLPMQEAAFYHFMIGFVIYDLLHIDPHHFVDSRNLDYNTLPHAYLSSVRDVYSSRAAMWVSEVALTTLLVTFGLAHVLLRLVAAAGGGIGARVAVFHISLAVPLFWAWPLLSTGLHDDPFVWLYKLFIYRSGDPKVLGTIVVAWILAIGVSVHAAIVASPTLDRISCRKLFHATVLVMFVPVLAMREIRAFVTLSLGGAVCLFLLAEFLRLRLLPDELAPLTEFFELFLSSRAQSHRLITSHLTLILATGLPVLVSPVIFLQCSEYLRNMESMGLLTVGVGDAAAAIVGVRFGKSKWLRDSTKSVEGSVAAFAAMTLLAPLIGALDGRAVATLALASLAEVFLEGNDNLSVPLYAMIVSRALRRGPAP